MKLNETMAIEFLKSIRDFPQSLDNPEGEEYTHGDLIEVFRCWAIEAGDCLVRDSVED
jgi:hypothetical protein